MTEDLLLSPLELMARDEERRLAILEVLEARFGALPPGAKEKVQALTEQTALRRALRLAVTSPSLEGFLASL